MAAPTPSSSAAPTTVLNPAVASLMAARTLLEPHRLTALNQHILLPIAILDTHPDNRTFDEEYAAELGRGLKDRLDVEKHPCQVIVDYKDKDAGLVETESAADAFVRLFKEHPEAGVLTVETQTSYDDLSWLLSKFNVSTW